MSQQFDLLGESSPLAPLADRMRPRSLEEFSGQQQLLGDTSTLRRAIENQQLHSMVFWGPPGTGKTTLARVLANQCEAKFISLSAVLAGVKDIRAAAQLSRIRSMHLHQKAHAQFSLLTKYIALTKRSKMPFCRM